MLSKQAEFAGHLFREGYPLWSPDPLGLPADREREGIKIGDIGYVKEDGHFRLLFDIRQVLQDHPSDPQSGSPPYQREFAPGDVIASPLTSWTVDIDHESNIGGRIGTTTQYHTVLSADGSHILLPHGADSCVAEHEIQSRFGALARRHAREWCKTARGMSALESGPLYLVTGFYKTVSWALASFRINGGTPVGVRCTIVANNVQRILQDDLCRWHPAGRFPNKVGPAPENHGRKNQSIFISGFVITPRQPVSHAEQSSVWTTKDFPSLSKVFLKGWRMDTADSASTEGENEEPSIDRVPRIQQRASHPGDIINRYLLTREPSAEVAVTHDTRWITLVDTGKISTIEDLEGHVERLVSEHYSIHLEHGTVYLGDKESTKEESPTPGLGRYTLPVHGHQSIIQIEETPFAGGELADIYIGTLRTSVKTIKVAVKVFRSHLANVDDFDEMVNQARLVIELWSTLDHINVLALIGTFTHHSSPFPAIVTPWTEHGNLSSYLNRSNRKLTDAGMIVLIHDVASGLQYLHSKNIVHGSLTTSNILVDTGGRASLDFFSLSAIVSAFSHVLMEGVEIPVIMVPTKETDVYALGSIMLQILAADQFGGIGTVRAALSGSIPERPDSPNLTDLWWTLIRRCFSLPAIRPSAKEIVEFAKRELLECPVPRGDLTEHQTLVAEMPADRSHAGLGGTSSSRTLVEVDIRSFGLGGRSKAPVPDPLEESDLLVTDLTDSIKLTNELPFAAGTFAEVYEGLLHNDTGTRIAIKVTKLYKNVDIRKRKMQVRYEIKVWSRLKHDNVLPLLGVSMSFGELPAMVSLCAENGTLTSYLNRRSQDLTDMQLLSLIHHVASGLQYLHSKNIMHGDLSGPNVLVDASGRALLSDFGLSVILGESALKSHMHGKGTLRWAAPELLNFQSTEGEDASFVGNAVPRKESDVYSFGSIMLQILSGKVPYPNYHAKDPRLEAMILQGITPSRPINPAISDLRWSFIQKCWSPLELRPSSEEIDQFSKRELSCSSLLQTQRANECSSTTTDLPDPQHHRSSRPSLSSDVVPPLTPRRAPSFQKDKRDMYLSQEPPDLTPYIIKLELQYVSGSTDTYRCHYRRSPLGIQEVAVQALRVIIDGKKDDIEHHKMLRRRLGIWKRLDHPNIVPFLGVTNGFGLQGSKSLVSLWMPNGTLYRFLEERGKQLSIGHRLQLLSDVAHGINYLHSHTVGPIVHGDPNSNNVLLDANFNACLTGFSLSSLIGIVPEGFTYLEMSSARPGAVRWAAPEQLDNGYERTTKSDIYTFGSVALEVLSGKKPWSEVSFHVDIVRRLLEGKNPKRPSSRPINDQHWAFIQRCWSPVEDRPSSQEVVSTVQEFLRSVPPFPPLSEVFAPSSPKTDHTPASSGVDLSPSHELTDKLKGKQRLVETLWETAA